MKEVARLKPFYDRNKPKICSFWVKGECNRGTECPFLHEEDKKKIDTNLANQNIKDRYHGKNDPVANKILKQIIDKEK